LLSIQNLSIKSFNFDIEIEQAEKLPPIKGDIPKVRVKGKKNRFRLHESKGLPTEQASPLEKNEQQHKCLEPPTT